MAFISRFYNSKNGDRTYNAADWADYFASFVGNGVFANPASGCQVVAAGNLSVKVRPGKKELTSATANPALIWRQQRRKAWSL